MENKPRTFISACKDFFGLKPGQSLSDFQKEVNSLSVDERAMFTT